MSRQQPDLFATRKPCYSEVNLPVTTQHVYLTDNLTSLNFSGTASNVQGSGGQNFSALSKADWSKFINLDRISSIVLHTDPQNGAQLHSEGKDDGVWFTINGPRLSWGKQVRYDNSGVASIVGAKDPMDVPRKLIRMQQDKWINFKVSVDTASLRRKAVPDEIEEGVPPKKVYCVCHVFGSTFKSEEREVSAIDDTAEFRLQFEVSVPLATQGDAENPVENLPAINMLEMTDVGIEIYEVAEAEREVGIECTTNAKKFVKEPERELIFCSSQGLRQVFQLEPEDNFADRLTGGESRLPEKTTYRMPLAPPFGWSSVSDEKACEAGVQITIQPAFAKGHPKFRPNAVPISPEFVGGGIITTLFTAHKGAWYDSRLGPGKFRSDHVANFVELTLQGLRFPKEKVIEFKIGGQAFRAKVIARFKPTEVPAGGMTHKIEYISGASTGLQEMATLDEANKVLSTEKGHRNIAYDVQQEDRAGAGTKYRIKASIYGFSAQSPALTRPKAGWAEVVGPNTGDSKLLRFQGCRLCLPLPPGCWSESAPSKRKVLIQVMSCDPVEDTPVNYGDFTGGAGQGRGENAIQEKVVYQAQIGFDHVMVDLVKRVSVFLGKKFPTEVDVWSNATKGDATDGCLNLDFALRDRDYVKAMLGQPNEKRALCVGDKAMLVVEEPMTYPPSEEEYRKRFFAGKWEQEQAEKTKGKGWPGNFTELRVPCLSSEYAESGLGDMVPRHPFKQLFIPSFCSDIVPHKYVLPLSEKQFMDRRLPGYYGKIVDDIVQQGGAPKGRKASTAAPKTVVNRISHINRSVPVTLLAVYADGTCDLEVSTEFMQKWDKAQYRRFAMPGTLLQDPGFKGGKARKVIEFVVKGMKMKAQVTQVRPAAEDPEKIGRTHNIKHLAANPGGKPPFVGKESSEWVTMDETAMTISLWGNEGIPYKNEVMRAVLKRVPTSQLTAVHGAGFNIYDAMFQSSEDVLKQGTPANNFDPRSVKYGDIAAKAAKLTLAAGPLPPDCSPAACEYEWSVRMRASNENEMYQFVAMLRRCVRLDSHHQASKMIEYQARAQVENPVIQQMNHGLRGGQLDVLLVEARRLKPPAGLLNRSEFKLHEGFLPRMNGTSAGEAMKTTPEGNTIISTYVNFRMLNAGQPIPYKGQKVQQSPVISGTDSPVWAFQPELAGSGGWTFRTGIIDPEKLRDLLIDFEVMQVGPVPLVKSRIGAISLPFTMRDYLTNPNEPFKNMWLPLQSMNASKMKTTNATGEIHIMTRWLPAEKIQIGPNAQPQASVRSTFLKEIWPRVTAQRLREPIYNLEVRYLHYNPNLVRHTFIRDNASNPLKVMCGGLRKLSLQKMPEAPKDHTRRHAEELYNALAYLHCVDLRQSTEWAKFDQAISKTDYAGLKLGELRLKWQVEEHSVIQLTELDDPVRAVDVINDLIQRGIPVSRRSRAWLELTLASRVMERDGLTEQGRNIQGDAARKAAESDYQQLLERGLPQRSDAMLQLQEDAFNMASWESSVPPMAELLDMHLKRISRAQRVCAALIETNSGVVYCESLLVIAFFLLLPQSDKEGRVPEDGSYNYMTESQAFWLLYTLICARVNGVYKEYYGTPQPVSHENPGAGKSGQLCAGSGAMFDVSLLESCLAYHENQVWMHMNALGFQLCSVFYGCFMRLYATYMPTSTVFRLWDVLFAQSVDTKAEPHNRSYLINLAFGVLRSKRNEILECESAQEVKDLLLGCLGSMYDMATVVDLIVMTDQFLWAGIHTFSSSKVAFMVTQREDLFKQVNQTTAHQNEVLKELCHKLPLGTIPQTKYMSPPETKGVTTKELLKDVIPVMHQSLEQAKKRETGKYWAMHRPQPLVMRTLNENSLDQAWHIFKASLHLKKPHPPVPFLVAPLPTRDGKFHGLELVNISAPDITKMLGTDVPAWSSRASVLWKAFNNHRANKNKQIPQTFDSLDPDAMEEHQTKTGLMSMFQNLLPQDSTQVHREMPREPGSQPDDKERVSLNEIFISLIACSRGTVGEKAAALFNIFSYSYPDSGTPHRTPVTKLARSICKGSEMAGVVEKNVSPPADEQEQRAQALRFTVYSNYPRKNTVVGHVFIPSLGPHITHGSTSEAREMSWNIWGLTPDAWQQFSNNDPNAGVAPATGAGGKKLVSLGEMTMSLAWTPKSIANPSEGQLMIHMKKIRFERVYVSDFYKMNPWVKVHHFDKEANAWKEVERWDPRGMIARDGQHSYFTTHGAYGGVINFEQSMMDSLIGQQGDNFHSWLRSGDEMGLRTEVTADGRHEGWWAWNETWGLQRSIEGFKMRPEVIHATAGKNALDLQGVRIIIQSLCQRTMMNLSNRQAICLADSIFNRSGAVPGIIQAILVPGAAEEMLSQFKSFLEVKQYFEEQKMKYMDVTPQLTMEHERQIAENGGYLNLFAVSYMTKSLSLSDMNISDQFQGSPKMLWVRYIRGGDGERCSKGIPVTADGLIEHHPNPGQGQKSPVEIEMETMDVWPQTKVTKEEFVSCMLHNPVLSESLRRLGNTESEKMAKKSISLDVSIMDPHQEQANEEFMDSVNVKQSILFEVWDSDMMKKDFLGEAFLPPLSSFGPRGKDVVLPLISASEDPDGPNGVSREPETKQIGGASMEKGDWLDKDKVKTAAATKVNDTVLGKEEAKDRKITGELYVSIRWRYPAYQVQEDGSVRSIEGEEKFGESLEDRVLVQEKLHTGKLSITIHKAKNLRRADARVGGDCDPQVTVWVRNDVKDMWRKQYIMRTKVIRKNRNPVWNTPDAKVEDIDILSGEYEARFPPEEDGWFAEVKAAFRTKREQENIQTERDLKAIQRFGGDGLPIRFLDGSEQMEPGMSLKDPGMNHKVEIFQGDSVREFKVKLTKACEMECKYWKQQKGDMSEEAQKYDDINIGNRHLVMVFVPSAKVRRLSATKHTEGNEYKSAQQQALLDPSSWQPLDPAMTFAQYQQFGFFNKRGSGATMLRIVEATEAYKLQNLRYKEFDRELHRKSYEDTDTPEQCFGWAKYTHSDDVNMSVGASTLTAPAALQESKIQVANMIFSIGDTITIGDEVKRVTATSSVLALDSPLQKTWTPGTAVYGSGKPTVEWRPCFAQKVKTQAAQGQAAQPSLNYNLKWAYPVNQPRIEGEEATKRIQRDREENSTEQPKSWVLLKPRCPAFDDDVHPAHSELLEQASILRQSGKGDFEIASSLQKLLEDKWAAEMDGKAASSDDVEAAKPPPITPDVVRQYLNAEAEKSQKVQRSAVGSGLA
eukprot:TRINITY_DN32718_c0_g3_i1.p1 TRINITY_DN32718_c0_g3~~TRINITY_DN32718_c0_g3_i1.p1  ORF type:complete len:3402 (+),score=1051.59 TRINITY_DN32718_c0_g3_i1:472-10206(+)